MTKRKQIKAKKISKKPISKKLTAKKIKTPKKKQKKQKPDPLKTVIKSLGLKPCSFEVGNSGTCLYCDGDLPECGCFLMECVEQLEYMSEDFKRLNIGNKINTHILFNQRIFPRHFHTGNVLAYDTKAKNIIYKHYSLINHEKFFDVFDNELGWHPGSISYECNENT